MQGHQGNQGGETASAQRSTAAQRCHVVGTPCVPLLKRAAHEPAAQAGKY